MFEKFENLFSRHIGLMVLTDYCNFFCSFLFPLEVCRSHRTLIVYVKLIYINCSLD